MYAFINSVFKHRYNEMEKWDIKKTDRINLLKCVPKKVDWAKYLNRHGSKSIGVIKLSFCQNDSLTWGSFWQKDSLITCILFEQCLSRYIA